MKPLGHEPSRIHLVNGDLISINDLGLTVDLNGCPYFKLATESNRYCLHQIAQFEYVHFFRFYRKCMKKCVGR